MRPLLLAAKTSCVAFVLAALLAAVPGCESRATMMYRRAEEFFARGEYQLAAEEYQRLADTYPRSDVADAALYKLGHLYAVHLGNPRAAVAAYQRLVETYPSSPYSPTALLAVVRIAATRLRAPQVAATAVRRLEELYPSRPGLIVRAHLELARAYLRAGQPRLALRHARTVWQRNDVQSEHAAAAGLVMAEALESMSADDKPRAAAILEEVASRYPETLAAEEARKRLGLLYYAQRKEEARARAEALKRETRWLTGLSSFSRHRWSCLEMLDALRVLLAYHGVDVELGTLAALSGAAMVPVVPLDGTGYRLWSADPLPGVLEACGVSASVWNASRKEEAWEAARRAISGGRPVLIAYSRRQPWVVLGGWNAQRSEVGLLTAGRRSLRAVALKEFLAGWRPAAQVAPYIAFPEGHYYVLTASGKLAGPDFDALTAAALRHLREAVTANDFAQRPAAIAHEAASVLRDAAASGQCPASLLRWAEEGLPRWAEARRVLADFLAPLAGDIANQAAHIADVLGALRSAVLAARDSDAPARDLSAAASYADRLAAEEENLLAALREFTAARGER